MAVIPKGAGLKKLVAVVAVLVLALVLAGCGGGGEATPAGTTDTAGTSTAPGTPTAPATGARPTLPYAFDVNNSQTPAFFKNELKKKEPVLVAFYADDAASEALIQEIQTAYGEYEGVVAVMLLRTENNDEVAHLADQFKIGYVPYVAVLNRSGTVIYEKHGYADSKVLEQALYNAVNR